MMRLMLSLFLILAPSGDPTVLGWSWRGDQSIKPSTQRNFYRDIEEYKIQVFQGLSTPDRLRILNDLITTYKPQGMDTGELEAEHDHLQVEEKERRVEKARVVQMADKEIKKKETDYKSGRFQEALLALQTAATARELTSVEKVQYSRLSAIAAVLPQEVGTGKVSDLLRKSTAHYLENDPARAMNALSYASDLAPTRADIPRLKSMIVNEYPALAPPPSPPGMNFTDQKLQSALENIYRGRFLEAVRECHDVLELEPANVLALARLGSAYHALGNDEKARTYWQEALVLDPNHPALQGFSGLVGKVKAGKQTNKHGSSLRTYKVKRGDTLPDIAQTIYGDKNHWKRIYQANKDLLKNPYQLSAGQQLKLP